MRSRDRHDRSHVALRLDELSRALHSDVLGQFDAGRIRLVASLEILRFRLADHVREATFDVGARDLVRLAARDPAARVRSGRSARTGHVLEELEQTIEGEAYLVQGLLTDEQIVARLGLLLLQGVLQLDDVVLRRAQLHLGHLAASAFLDQQ